MDLEAIEDARLDLNLDDIINGENHPTTSARIVQTSSGPEPIIIRGNGNITIFGLNNYFNPEYPTALHARVAPEEFKATIDKINSLLRKSLSLQMKWIVFGCLCCCCTFGCSLWPVVCMNKKTRLSIEKLLDWENSHLYQRLGLQWKLERARLSSSSSMIDCRNPTLKPNMEQVQQVFVQPARLKDTSVLKQLIQDSEINEPIVFKGIHFDWEPCLWSLDMWGKIIAKDDPKTDGLLCRVGLKDYPDKEPQWESKTGQMMLSWHNLVNWVDDKRWVYYDYKNIVDVIDAKYFKKFEWNRVGFPEREGKVSNLWIGTSGSYTPCHFDTYGCNLVSQIKGRKTWLMFPPSDTNNLRPSRIPYEESSVYSLINFCSPSPSQCQDLAKCRGLKVTLEPGDVLFVPPLWWHFVKSDEFSISVNTWIQQDHDNFARVQEAAIRFVIGSVVALATPDSIIDILNPNEEDLTESSEEYLSLLLRRSHEDYLVNLDKHKATKVPVDNHANTNTNLAISNGEPSRKKCKTHVDELMMAHPFIRKLAPYVFNYTPARTATTLYGGSTSANVAGSLPSPFLPPPPVPSLTPSPSKAPSSPRHKHYNHLINAIGHPHILKQICEQYIKNIAEDN